MRIFLCLLIAASPVAAQNPNFNRCEIVTAEVHGSRLHALGKFDTLIGEEERTVRSFRLPRTKLFVVASVFYTDESMASDKGSDSTSLELTLSRVPRRRVLQSISLADAEFPIDVSVGRVSLLTKASGKPQLIVMECRRMRH